VVLGADAGDEEHRDLGLGGLLDAGRDQLDLVDPGEAVVERRPAQAVAVGDLDDLDAGRVQGVHGGADLLLGELVRHRVAAVAQGRVGDPELPGLGHAVTLSARRWPMTSPTWAAAEVMMSRLPAYSGR